jgi:hypothetical protein
MPEEKRENDVDRFIEEQIESVPHLEALLLIWRKHPKAWSIQEMASALYVPEPLAEDILRNLNRRDLLNESNDCFGLNKSEQREDLLRRVDATYRRELIRISRMIHEKAPSAVREFARSFRFTKEEN